MKLYCISLFLCFSIISFGQIQFSEQASNLGCDNSSYGIGSLGGGISFFDFDNDGWDDITLASQEGDSVRFFKNNEGVFSSVDFEIPDPLQEGKSVVWVDFDNDSDYDFLLAGDMGGTRLFENDGNMNFTDITNTSGIALPNSRIWGASFGDYDNDGWLDLFLSTRNNVAGEIYNILFKNNEDGTFTDVTVNAGISTASHVTFCTAFFDYDKDGWQDIYLSNDRYEFPNILYKNNGDGTFTDVSEVSGANIAFNSMSTTIGDYNNDGWLDIYLANTPQGNALLRNNGNGTFTDVVDETGTGFFGTAWGSVFLDADNDGDEDLYVSSSLFGENQVSAVFYENDGDGSFNIPNISGFEDDFSESYSNALGDINNDGYPDIAVLNFAPDDIFLWQNDSSQENNWLKVKLIGEESNRQGVGAWIEISVNGERQINYTLCGEGFLGQNSAYEFFGIGVATAIDYVKVNWPSGIETVIENPEVNQNLIINEEQTLGFTDRNIIEEVTLYPNPAQDKVFFEFSPFLDSVFLVIEDLQGRIMYRDIVNESETIDVSGYANGVYYFKFSDLYKGRQGGGKRIVEKVILAR